MIAATTTPYTLNLRGRLLPLDHPLVMGILNATPDSFYDASRCGSDTEAIARRARAIIEEGGDIIDIGAYSSRPGADDVSPEEEWQRLDRALDTIRSLYPEAILSDDTFRADIARRCAEQYGVQIINDISGGDLDPEMFDTRGRPAHRLHTHAHEGYPTDHAGSSPLQPPHGRCDRYFARRIDRLHRLG